MRLLVGLGNPGAEYADTRHNAGFRVADGAALLLRRPEAVRAHRAEAVRGAFAGEPCVIIKPQTYMNLSGGAVAAWLAQLGLAPADLLVVSDEVQFPPGEVKLKAGGSAGGHNGLQSVIDALGTQNFPRLRVGVGRDPRVPLDVFVLAPVPLVERPAFDAGVAKAVEAVKRWLRSGLPAAMNFCNAREGDDAADQ
ncbi:MAG TPA: aminoacyl-tRNA hydrolase [bacterium]|mgnify:CR=1 FL=1|nr:aminoacyl-tRNA hydrolase [bacterium]